MSKIVRVEFVLSMPNRASWNGQWSGAGKRYAIIRIMSQAAAEALLAGGGQWAWFFSDGWSALVVARQVQGRAQKSDGFCGYDWMVHSICDHGQILDEQAIKAKAQAKADLAAVRMDGESMMPTTTPEAQKH